MTPADAMIGKINDEVDRLLAVVDQRGGLEWDDDDRHGMRMVRRVTFGEGTADDEQLTEDLLALRATANRAFLHPRRRGLRACMLDSLRLWPTTPAVLRETTRATQWEDGPVPENTSVLVCAPFFHRDDEHVDAAHRFEPDLWARERTEHSHRDRETSIGDAGPGVVPEPGR